MALNATIDTRLRAEDSDGTCKSLAPVSRAPFGSEEICGAFGVRWSSRTGSSFRGVSTRRTGDRVRAHGAIHGRIESVRPMRTAAQAAKVAGRVAVYGHRDPRSL